MERGDAAGQMAFDAFEDVASLHRGGPQQASISTYGMFAVQIFDRRP
jgi:hypothetical protein